MKKVYVLAGVLAFLSSLIALAPANVVYGWLLSSDLPANVRLYDIKGTLFHGHAGQAQIHGLGVQDLTWHMHPADLLLGKISLDLTGRMAGGRTSATVNLGLGNRIGLRHVISTATLSDLAPFLDMDYLPVKGQLGLSLKHAEISHGHLISATGRLNAGELSWTLSQPAVALGDYKAGISTGQQGVVATLSNSSGPLQLSGQCVLTHANTWQVHVRLRARPDAGAKVKELLGNLGRPGPQGWYKLRQRGRL